MQSYALSLSKSGNDRLSVPFERLSVLYVFGHMGDDGKNLYILLWIHSKLPVQHNSKVYYEAAGEASKLRKAEGAV